MLVVDRRGGAGEVEDRVHLDAQRLRDVVADQLEARMAEEVLDVLLAPGLEVVHAHHFVAALDEPVTEMRAEEAGAAGDQVASAEMDLRHGRSLCVGCGAGGSLQQQKDAVQAGWPDEGSGCSGGKAGARWAASPWSFLRP